MKTLKSLFLNSVLWLSVGALTYFFNRLVVILFWPLIDQEMSVVATSKNFAILTPAYVLFFFLLGKTANKFVFPVEVGASHNSNFLNSKNLWYFLKLNFTPLELVSAGASSKKNQLVFYIFGLSQITLGHAFFTSFSSGLNFIYVFIGFLINLLVIYFALVLSKFAYDDISSLPNWRLSAKHLFILLFALPAYYLIAGYAANYVYLNFSNTIYNILLSFFEITSGSKVLAENLTPIFINKFVFTERALLFQWSDLVSHGDQRWALLVFFTLNNFFNFHSLILVFFMIYFFSNFNLFQKLKNFISITVISFFITHFLFFLILLSYRLRII